MKKTFLAIALAAALSPMLSAHAAVARTKPADTLESRAERIGYQLRTAEMCGVDPATLLEYSDPLADELSKDVEAVHADMLPLTKKVMEGTSRANAEFKQPPTAAACKANTDALELAAFAAAGRTERSSHPVLP